MAFLALNGLPLPISVGNASGGFDEIGEGKRAVDGSLVLNRRGVKRTLEFESPPRPIAEALFLRDLILGVNCDVWSFASHLFSAKGRPANVSIGAQFSAGPPAGKWGGGVLDIQAGPDSINFPILTALGSTVMLWCFNNGTTWTLEVASFSPAGTVLLTRRVSTAGVVTGPSPLAINWDYVGGSPRFSSQVAQCQISDAWLIGRSLAGISTTTLDTEWLPGLGTVTSARGPSPRVYLTGDIIDPSVATGAQLLARGKMNTVRISPSRRGGSYVRDDHTVAATFEEI